MRIACKCEGLFSPCLHFDVVALLLLFYVFLPSLMCSLLLLLGIGSPLQAYWGGLAVLAIAAFCLRGKIGRADILCTALFLVAAHVFAYVFFDIFHDGLAYHQLAISHLLRGFNPIYDGVLDFGRSADVWNEAATYYPKVTWYFAAAVTSVWGDIQVGKAFNPILLLAAILSAFHYTQGEHLLKRMLWMFSCLNPIMIFQLTGYVVDGALASLTVISLLYANFFFIGKPLPRLLHITGIIALGMLFCIKTSGFAYGSIVLFGICLCEATKKWLTLRGKNVLWRIAGSIAEFLKLGIKLGLPVLTLVFFIGFAPYITNILEHRHVFYPIFQFETTGEQRFSLLGSTEKSTVYAIMGDNEEKIYPTLHNRFTRLLFSIFAYPTYNALYPAELKNPFGFPWLEWEMYRNVGYSKAGGLGPLFSLLFLVALFYRIILRGSGDFWLLFTLLLMIFMQPYAWEVRYAPFIWLLPFVLCLAVPPKKEFLLVVPLLLAAVNIMGVGYIALNEQWRVTQDINKALSPYRGQFVLLDRSIFQCDGFFDRFNIKQKFANPEETIFLNHSWRDPQLGRNLGRPAFGSNIAFEEDIPQLPDFPLALAEERAYSWTRMAEGVIFYTLDQQATLQNPFSYPVPKGWWNYSGKIKFFMQVKKKTADDVAFIFTATPRTDEKGNVIKQSMKVFVNNHPLGEWLFDRPGSTEKTIVIPKALLEESYNDEMHLLTLMFYLSDPDAPNVKQQFSLMFEKMEFRPVTQ